MIVIWNALLATMVAQSVIVKLKMIALSVWKENFFIRIDAKMIVQRICIGKIGQKINVHLVIVDANNAYKKKMENAHNVKMDI